MGNNSSQLDAYKSPLESTDESDSRPPTPSQIQLQIESQSQSKDGQLFQQNHSDTERKPPEVLTSVEEENEADHSHEVPKEDINDDDEYNDLMRKFTRPNEIKVLGENTIVLTADPKPPVRKRKRRNSAPEVKEKRSDKTEKAKKSEKPKNQKKQQPQCLKESSKTSSKSKRSSISTSNIPAIDYTMLRSLSPGLQAYLDASNLLNKQLDECSASESKQEADSPISTTELPSLLLSTHTSVSPSGKHNPAPCDNSSRRKSNRKRALRIPNLKPDICYDYDEAPPLQVRAPSRKGLDPAESVVQDELPVPQSHPLDETDEERDDDGEETKRASEIVPCSMESPPLHEIDLTNVKEEEEEKAVKEESPVFDSFDAVTEESGGSADFEEPGWVSAEEEYPASDEEEVVSDEEEYEPSDSQESDELDEEDDDDAAAASVASVQKQEQEQTTSIFDNTFASSMAQLFDRSSTAKKRKWTEFVNETEDTIPPPNEQRNTNGPSIFDVEFALNMAKSFYHEPEAEIGEEEGSEEHDEEAVLTEDDGLTGFEEGDDWDEEEEEDDDAAIPPEGQAREGNNSVFNVSLTSTTPSLLNRKSAKNGEKKLVRPGSRQNESPFVEVENLEPLGDDAQSIHSENPSSKSKNGARIENEEKGEQGLAQEAKRAEAPSLRRQSQKDQITPLNPTEKGDNKGGRRKLVRGLRKEPKEIETPQVEQHRRVEASQASYRRPGKTSKDVLETIISDAKRSANQVPIDGIRVEIPCTPRHRETSKDDLEHVANGTVRPITDIPSNGIIVQVHRTPQSKAKLATLPVFGQKRQHETDNSTSQPRKRVAKPTPLANEASKARKAPKSNALIILSDDSDMDFSPRQQSSSPPYRKRRLPVELATSEPSGLHAPTSHPSSPQNARVRRASADLARATRNSTASGLPRVLGTFSEGEKAALEKFKTRHCNKHGLDDNAFLQKIHNSARGFLTLAPFWDEACEAVPFRDRRAVQKFCRRYWHQAEKRGPWSLDEDKQLWRLYREKGVKWNRIAEEMGRAPHDVRDHWRNILKDVEDPDLDWEVEEHMGMSKGRWTASELEELCLAVGEVGALTLWEKRKMSERRRRARERGVLSSTPTPEPQSDSGNNKSDIKGVGGLIVWGSVSERMKGKRARLQCRYRWKRLRHNGEVSLTEEIRKAGERLGLELGIEEMERIQQKEKEGEEMDEEE